MASAKRPRCIVIAGPNGSGKRTFARDFLPDDVGVVHFINADLIASGLSPLDPRLAAVAAGRLVLTEMKRLAALRLASPKVALRRVAARVRQGGHHVPREDVERRFIRGWENFQHAYRPLADAWAVYDNSGSTPRLKERVGHD